jgi:predicted nucleotidyltransferase component of viral defense system
MPRPTRETTAGRAYNDLRNFVRRQGRSTDAIMIDYVLERFLFRLAASPLGGRHFVLKGGLLLSQFGARRMTRDIDILGPEFDANDAEIIRPYRGNRHHRNRRRRHIRHPDAHVQAHPRGQRIRRPPPGHGRRHGQSAAEGPA